MTPTRSPGPSEAPTVPGFKTPLDTTSVAVKADAPNRPSVAVIIPTKNEAARIATCLQAIRRQTTPPAEIIVVDGNSTDDTAIIARELGARVVTENYGTRAGACQTGIENTHCEIVAFTDADCIPGDSWLEGLLSSLSKGVSGAGGRILNEGDGTWQRAINLTLGTVMGSANSIQGRTFTVRRRVASISGCNSLYRRSNLLSVGGFRTDLVTLEDRDINRRMLALGDLLYVPEAIVHHHHGRGLRDFSARMVQYGYGRGQKIIIGWPLLAPVLAPVVIFALVVAPMLAVIPIALYMMATLSTGLTVAIKARYLPSALLTPVVLWVEHCSYALGFWKAVFTSNRLSILIGGSREDQG